MPFEIGDSFIAQQNAKASAALHEDFQALTRQLERRGCDIERLVERAMAFRVAVPSWGVGTGGTPVAPWHAAWVGDGGNFRGQQNTRKAPAGSLEGLRAINKAGPEGLKLFIEHKLYEPAFYSTVLNDWGTSYYCVRELGERAFSLVDLGHHAPNVNIEMIVARLIQVRKLAGFHF